MRKIFVSAVLLFVFQTSFCQLDKKYWLVGGSGSFHAYKQEYTLSNYFGVSKNEDINISAAIGYFLIDKFVAGLEPAFTYSHAQVSGAGGRIARDTLIRLALLPAITF
ncbi:MAG: hypothetical protein HYR66_01445 [Sphingobacteriales bacterium]|nr:hypothetical protein [Sphingobacteriales bacterium]MBI3719959.1 hypothetical protein [Sphingobacteriales bacterium]